MARNHKNSIENLPNFSQNQDFPNLQSFSSFYQFHSFPSKSQIVIFEPKTRRKVEPDAVFGRQRTRVPPRYTATVTKSTFRSTHNCGLFPNSLLRLSSFSLLFLLFIPFPLFFIFQFIGKVIFYQFLSSSVSETS